MATELNAEVGDRFRNTYAEIKKDSVGYLKRNSNFVLLMRQLSPSVTRMIADVGILLDGMISHLPDGFFSGSVSKTLTNGARSLKIIGLSMEITMFIFWFGSGPGGQTIWDASMELPIRDRRGNSTLTGDQNFGWTGEEVGNSYRDLSLKLGDPLSTVQRLIQQFGTGELFEIFFRTSIRFFP